LLNGRSMRLSRLLLSAFVTLSFACQIGEPPFSNDPPPIQDGDPPQVVPPTQPPATPPEVTPPPTPPPETPPPEPPSTPEAQQPFVLPPVQTSVQDYALVMPDAVLQKFLADPNTPEQDAVFKANGATYNVKVRLRGASARTFPKKSWNVSFAKGVRFEGRTSLNLVAEYADATLLAEKISYDLLAAMRVPAPRAKFVRVRVNGVYQGAFLDIEQVGKPFLEAHGFADKDGSIYRCGWKDNEFKTWKVPYQGNWAKKTNEDEPNTDLTEVLDIINHTPEPQLPATLAQHLELESLLRSMVMDVLMSNNFVEDSESYFVHDKVTQRWSYVPWDLNNVDARWWYPIPADQVSPSTRHPLFPFTLTDAWTQKMYDQRKTETQSYPGYLPVFSNLGSRVVLNLELRARLETYLRKALDELFKPEVMNPYIDSLHAAVDPSMRNDPYMDYEKFRAGRTFLRTYVARRRQFILDELKRYAARKPSLVIDEFDPHAGSIVLANRGSQPVSLGGKTLTTNLRVSLRELVSRPVATVLPKVTLAPGETRRFTASELGLSFPEKGEVGVFDGVSVVGYFDVLFYGALPEGQRYVQGSEGWEAR
jgi:spore coat protein H